LAVSGERRREGRAMAPWHQTSSLEFRSGSLITLTIRVPGIEETLRIGNGKVSVDPELMASVEFGKPPRAP
jgi:hypothetical protein